MKILVEALEQFEGFVETVQMCPAPRRDARPVTPTDGLRLGQGARRHGRTDIVACYLGHPPIFSTVRLLGVRCRGIAMSVARDTARRPGRCPSSRGPAASA